jgi:hypothetical protein
MRLARFFQNQCPMIGPIQQIDGATLLMNAIEGCDALLTRLPSAKPLLLDLLRQEKRTEKNNE